MPEMQVMCNKVIEICKEKDVDILITCTLRSLEEQAQLYGQSRTPDEVLSKQKRLRQKGFGFLADIFDSITIKRANVLGKHVTFAGPGESFHNYREAFDSVPLVNGKAQWVDPDPTVDEWKVYGEAAVSVGLDWAGNWPKFKEMPHCQFRPGSNPLTNYSPPQIRTILENNGLL